MKTVLVLSVASFLAFSLPAQRPSVQPLTVADGLSQGMVFDVLQSSDGFLWAATKNGLSRYDGYRFEVFRHDPFNPFSIADNQLRCLLEDRRGWLWVGTEQAGVSVRDKGSGQFFHFHFAPTPASASPTVTAMLEDGNGSVWVATADGWLHEFSFPPGFSFSSNNRDSQKTDANIPAGFVEHFRFSAAPGGGKRSPACLYLTRRGELLVGADELLRLADNQRFEVVPMPVKLKIAQVFEDREGNLWVLGYGQVLRRRQGEWRSVRLSAYYLHFIGQAENGDFWVSADDRLFRLPPDELLSAGLENRAAAYRQAGPFISGCMDEGGLLWLGTAGYGMVRLDFQPPKFQRHLPGESLYRLFVLQDGSLWAKRFRGDFFQIDLAKNTLLPGGLFGERFYDVKDVAQGPDGTLWAWVTDREERIKLVRRLPHGQELKISEPGLDNATFREGRLMLDREGQIRVAGAGGALVTWDVGSETFKRWKDEGVLKKSGAGAQPTAFFQDKNGDCWLGTENGLVRFRKEAGSKPEIYQTDPARRNSLAYNHISCLLDDPKNPSQFLWIGTKGGGLNRLDKQSGDFRHFKTADGLPDELVYGILADSYPPPKGGKGGGRLWMSTNRGLAQFDPATGVFKNFTEADGLQSNEFNTGSFLKTPEETPGGGRLLFGGIGGLNVFVPEEMPFNKHSPKVAITGLKVNNEPFDLHSFAGGQSLQFLSPGIQLAHYQNLVTVEFTALDFSNPFKNQYRYRLAGIDPGWVEAGSRRFANYARLPPGDYLFEVHGSNNDGIWSQQPATLRIRILPPWWRTKLAWLAYELALAGAAFALYRFQINRLKMRHRLEAEHREAARLAELDRLKTDFFSNITHEFRTPLTLILGPLREVIERIQDEEALQKLALVERNSQQLLVLINQLLDLGKLESGSMKVSLARGNAGEFTQQLVESFLAHARQKGIRLDYFYSKTLPGFDFDADKYRTICDNLLSNALKFTPADGKVAVEVKHIPETSQFQLIVSDSGIGIEATELPRIFERFYQAGGSHTRPTAAGTGIGLALSKELAEIMGGNITVESKPGTGSTFTLTLLAVGCWQLAVGSGQLAGSSEQQVFPPGDDGKYNQQPIAGSQLPTANSQQLTDAKELVLIVEDNADIRLYLRQSLDPQCYQILEATDGFDGLRKAFEHTPDLIVSDVMMPGMDGFELLQMLKSDRRTSHVPFILLTAKAATDSRLKGLKFGADEYLTKPFLMEELRVRIEKLLENRRRLQAFFQQNGYQVSDSQPLLPSPDRQFIEQATALIDQHLGEEDFDTETFCKALVMSRSNLHRKLKALTNLSTSHFIRSVRLERARALLLAQAGNVSEVAWQTGFSSIPYFSRCFKERFGVSPSEAGRG